MRSCSGPPGRNFEREAEHRPREWFSCTTRWPSESPRRPGWTMCWRPRRRRMQTRRPIPTRRPSPFGCHWIHLAIRSRSYSGRSLRCRMSRSFPRCRSRRSSGSGCLFAAGRLSECRSSRRAHWRCCCSSIGYSWSHLSVWFVLERSGLPSPAAPRPARSSRQVSSSVHSFLLRTGRSPLARLVNVPGPGFVRTRLAQHGPAFFKTSREEFHSRRLAGGFPNRVASRIRSCSHQQFGK